MDLLLIFSVVGALSAVVLYLASLWFERRHMARSAKAMPPDWSAIDSYVELADAAGQWHSLSPEEFLAGPYRRYLELASDPVHSSRASARILEFCRSSLLGFAKSLDRNGGDGGSEQQRARAMAVAWFEGAPHADYMIEVLDGISSHNYRMTRAEYEEAVRN